MSILEESWHDLRLASRGLRRARGLTAAAVLTLAVGIAGTTAMFALIQAVLLRPLPVHEQDRLLVAWKEVPSAPAMHWPFDVSDIDVLGRESLLLERVAGVGYNGAGPLVVIEHGSASYVNSASVTGEFFAVLGVAPILGRSLNRGDDVTGAEKVAVVTHDLWQRRYGGSRDVIGRRMTVGGQPFAIVGVMPRDFEYPRGVEAWMTVAALTSLLTNPAFRVDVDLIARLRPGATMEQAADELQAIITRLEADAPPSAARGLAPVVRSYHDVVVGDVRTALLVLFGAVGLVLVIAGANVANLLLLRGESRRSELAVRAALGAGRGRLARQLLAESVVLALAAGAAGLVLTWWSLPALLRLVPEGLPRIESVHVDSGVLLFTLTVAVLSAALTGLAPVLSSTGRDLAPELRSGGRGGTGTAARGGRRALVVAQVALAVTIVAAAGLLARSLLRLQAADMGLAADRLVFVELALPMEIYVERARHLQFLNEVLAELEATPFITAATPVNVAPFSGTGGWDALFTAEDQSAVRAAGNPLLNVEAIHPNYFATFGVTLVRGRAFTEADREGALDVIIVSEDVAALAWPGQDPIGRRIKLGGPESTDAWRNVVGVARATRYRELREPRPTLYLPAEQFIVSADKLVLRTPSPFNLVAGLAREAVRRVDPDAQVMRVATFGQLLEEPLARPRFNALIIGLFAAAALLLAMIGLYAVMAASVRQRDREIGIRVALGADAAQVRGLVLGEAMRLAGLGSAIGLAITISTGRLLRGLLFQVHPLDPAALLTAALVLTAASTLASYLPAQRATSVDPVALLRAD